MSAARTAAPSRHPLQRAHRRGRAAVPARISWASRADSGSSPKSQAASARIRSPSSASLPQESPGARRLVQRPPKVILPAFPEIRLSPIGRRREDPADAVLSGVVFVAPFPMRTIELQRGLPSGDSDPEGQMARMRTPCANVIGLPVDRGRAWDPEARPSRVCGRTARNGPCRAHW